LKDIKIQVAESNFSIKVAVLYTQKVTDIDICLIYPTLSTTAFELRRILHMDHP
jgi:hypothetical protein